jgi:hypothetical protein
MISDIIVANGQQLLPGIVNGKKDSQQHSSLQWPDQKRPAAPDWVQWHHFLQHISNGTKLLRGLGHWIAMPHQEWQWFYHGLTKKVYQKLLNSAE